MKFFVLVILFLLFLFLLKKYSQEINMFFKDQGDRGHSPMDYTDNNDKGEKEGGTDGDHGGE